MSLLAETRRPKVLAKHMLDNGSKKFPSNFKRRKYEAVRTFPVNCGPSNGVNSEFVAFHSLANPVTSSESETDGGECECSSDGAKNLAIVPAVPLRSTPVSKEDDDDVDFEELFKDDIKKVEAIIARIEVFMSVFNTKWPKRAVQVGDGIRQEEMGGVMVVAESAKQMVEDGTKFLKGGKGQDTPKLENTSQGGNGVVLGEVEAITLHATDSGVGNFEMEESQGNEVTEYELFRGRREEKQTMQMLGSLDESSSLGKNHLDERMAKLDGCNNVGRRSNINDCKSIVEQKGLINLSVVKHGDPQGGVVSNVLKLFEEQCVQLLKERKFKSSREDKAMSFLYQEVATRLKKQGMWLSSKKPFGHIPGIKIGDEFKYRAELVVIGLHGQFFSGIDYIDLDGKIYASSIVDSGLYENKSKSLDVLVYSGHGGNPKVGSHKVEDQKLQKGNLALMNSKEMGYPIRVIYKRRMGITSRAVGIRKKNNLVYVYDGLYTIKKSWQVRDQKEGKLVFKFELHRMPGQPRMQPSNAKLEIQGMLVGVCMVDDISQGNRTS